MFKVGDTILFNGSNSNSDTGSVIKRNSNSLTIVWHDFNSPYRYNLKDSRDIYVLGKCRLLSKLEYILVVKNTD